MDARRDQHRARAPDVLLVDRRRSPGRSPLIDSPLERSGRMSQDPSGGTARCWRPRTSRRCPKRRWQEIAGWFERLAGVQLSDHRVDTRGTER